MTTHPLSGVYAAAITPLNPDFTPALDDIPLFLDFLAQRGCHGALLLGTTGEGTSFAPQERLAIFEAATEVRQTSPDFRLLAGTGTPSLDETIYLTKSAFDLGFEGVVVLPPYYYHQASEDGFFLWFQQVLNQAVPQDGYLLGYHIPAQSGVPLSKNLLIRLKEAFPSQFAGLKDSSANAEHTHQLQEDFDDDLAVLVGNDKFLSQALEVGAAGSITAMANLYSPSLRSIFDAHLRGEQAPETQAYINTQRLTMDRYQPFAPTIKALVAHLFGFPLWPVAPPLTPLPQEMVKQVVREMTNEQIDK